MTKSLPSMITATSSLTITVTNDTPSSPNTQQPSPPTITLVKGETSPMLPTALTHSTVTTMSKSIPRVRILLYSVLSLLGHPLTPSSAPSMSLPAGLVPPNTFRSASTSNPASQLSIFIDDVSLLPPTPSTPIPLPSTAAPQLPKSLLALKH